MKAKPLIFLLVTFGVGFVNTITVFMQIFTAMQFAGNIHQGDNASGLFAVTLFIISLYVSIVMLVLHAVCHVVFLIASLTLLKNIEIYSKDFSLQKDKLSLNIIRVLGYFLTIAVTFCIFSIGNDRYQISIWSILYFFVSLFTGCMYIVWAVSLLKCRFSTTPSLSE